MYRTILLPLDGSQLAESALTTAARLATRAGARLHLVRGHRPYPYLVGNDRQWDTRLRHEESDYLARVARRVEREFGIVPSIAILDGLLVPSLCDAARGAESALIVMATHGYTGLSRLWLGSVADEVVREATTPVLLVRADVEGRPAVPGASPFATVLLPLDGSQQAEQAIPHALTLAELCDARLLLLRVVEPVRAAQLCVAPAIGASQGYDESMGTRVEHAEGYITNVTMRLRMENHRLRVSGEVRVADSPAAAILELAETQGADLMVLAAHRRGLAHLAGRGVSDRILRGGPRAMLLVRAEEDST